MMRRYTSLIDEEGAAADRDEHANKSERCLDEL